MLLLTEFTSAASNTEGTSRALGLYCPHCQSPASGSTGFTQNSWLQLRDISELLSKPSWLPVAFPEKKMFMTVVAWVMHIKGNI